MESDKTTQLDINSLNKQELCQNAEKFYFDLARFYKKDYQLAKELSKHSNKSAQTIYKYLKYFSFRNKNSTISFLTAAQKLKNELKHIKPNIAHALILSPNLNNESCIEIANDLKRLNIAPSAIQLLYNTKDKFERELFKYNLNIMLDKIDFIVYVKGSKYDKYIINFAKKNNIELINFEDPYAKEDIYYFSIQKTLENKKG